MLASGLFAGFLKVAVVAVSLGGLTAGAYYAYQIGPGGSSGVSGQIGPAASVSPTVVSATPTPTAEPPTPQPTPTATAPALATLPPPTQPPAPTPTAEKKWPALPPPPPKPESPVGAERGTVEGGQWYAYGRCLSFFLPGGYTFEIHTAVNDPGGFNSIAFLVFGTESVVSSVGFHADTAQELSRNAREVSLGPVFDQIAATISRDC